MSNNNYTPMMPRVAHFFRDVDLKGSSCPEFVPEKLCF